MSQPSKTRENVDQRAARPDPYFAWAKATGFRYLPAGATAVPLLIELADGVSVQAFAKGGWLASKRLESAVRVPPIYAEPPRGIEQARYCTALVAIKELDRVVDDAGWKKLVARYGFGLPVYAPFAAAATSGPEPAAGSAKQRALPAGAALAAATTSAPRRAGQRSQGVGGSSGGAGNTAGVRGPVVIGVIDDGIAFAHEAFLARPGATRIKSLWNQEAAVPVPPATVPAAFLYGQELPDTVINNALAQFTHAGLVDEDAVYRHTGHEQYTSGIHKAVGRRAAHGTHVLDLAAALEPATPLAERPIVAVQLPSAVTGDTSGAHLNPQAIEAILYILQQTERLGAQHGKPLPVVINLSYGMHAGPHDGTHVIEAAIDQIIELWSTANAPVAIVLPAGNSRLTRCHSQLTLAADEAKTLHWRVQPDDRTPSSMEIWLPAPPAGEATAKVEVEVKDPTGAVLPVTIKEGEAFPSPLTTPVPCFVDYAAPAFPGARTKIVIVLAPTAPTDPPDPAEKLAPAGVWEVKVRNSGTQRVTIDAWIQRDDTPLGYSIVGRQSYFDDPQYRRFNDTGGEIELDDNATASYVRRSGTLSAIGTGARSVVVGGFRRRDGRPVKYSSLGPALAAFDGALVRPGPDAAAVCEESVTCHGVLAAGSRSGAVVAMNGTSVAAPQIARWIADRYAAGDFSDARASVAAAARLRPFNQSPRFNELAPPPARDEAGAGCIDLPSRRAQRRSGRNA